MSDGRPMQLVEAQEIAAHVYAGLERHCSRLVVAGSIRRERLVCGDIEIVLEPHMAGDLFGERAPIIQPIHELLREAGVWKLGGDRHVRIGDCLKQKGVRLDVFIVHPPAQWGSIVAIRTGPGILGKYCMTKMKSRGFLHYKGHAERKDTRVLVPTPQEGDFFKLAGVPHVAPNQRDRLAKKIGAT